MTNGELLTVTVMANYEVQLLLASADMRTAPSSVVGCSPSCRILADIVAGCP